MRLLCLHADTVQALQQLGTSVDDLTPAGLWDTPYHLVTVSPEQREALQRLRVALPDGAARRWRGHGTGRTTGGRRGRGGGFSELTRPRRYSAASTCARRTGWPW
jgi:hypothetical protein